MSINFLPLGNAIDLVTSAVTDSITGSAITDAVLTAVLKTEGGTTLATSSALTHTGGGVYKGTFDISAVSITLNTHYYLIVAASNYAVQWKHLYRAEDRPFMGVGSAAIDTTPGTSGLPALSGIPLGDGTGAFAAIAATSNQVVLGSGAAGVADTNFGSTTGLAGASNMSPRHATLIIAASDSVHKAGADYICPGTNDTTMINTAIAALPAGGRLIFRDGHYICTTTPATITGTARK